MNQYLSEVSTTKKNGNEEFTLDSLSTSHKLIDFWSWSVSDLVSNATRGRLAEFIVATAMNIELGVRVEWDAYDLTSPEGIKIEVKSSAYIQSWHQEKYSDIKFSIKEARVWDSEQNKFEKIPTRSADVYVFCLLKHKDKSTVDPLNLDQWEFYILPVEKVNNYTRSKLSITLKSLQSLTEPVNYNQIQSEVLKLHSKP